MNENSHEPPEEITLKIPVESWRKIKRIADLAGTTVDTVVAVCMAQAIACPEQPLTKEKSSSS